MAKTCYRALLAVTLVSSLGLAMLPAQAASAALSGRVFRADGSSPAPNVVVVLLDPASDAEFRAVPTGTDGKFSVGAPAGRYALVVETPEGAFLAAESVELTDAGRPPLSLVLNPGARVTGLAAQSGASWTKWVFVGAVGVAALFVIDEVTSEEEVPVSPF